MPEKTSSPDLLLSRRLLPRTQKHGIDTSITGMRIHELAIQRWLHRSFILAEGYPIPVVFASPVDAYSEISNQWKLDNNPYKYLLDLKDENGTPLYEPYPANIRYPIISVTRRGWVPRISASWGIHSWRKAYYPSIASDNPALEGSGTLTRDDLSATAKVRMPTGWDYKYEINHYCNYPETQAWFVNSVMRALSYAAGTMQTWIPVFDPTFSGVESRSLRLYLEGSIDTPTEWSPEGDQMTFRTAFTVVLEGYSTDPDVEVHPALWKITTGTSALPPEDLGKLDDPRKIIEEEDLREFDANQVFNAADDLPKT